MVRLGNPRRYVNLTLLATPLQDIFIYKTIISGIQAFLCLSLGIGPLGDSLRTSLLLTRELSLISFDEAQHPGRTIPHKANVKYFREVFILMLLFEIWFYLEGLIAFPFKRTSILLTPCRKSRDRLW